MNNKPIALLVYFPKITDFNKKQESTKRIIYLFR